MTIMRVTLMLMLMTTSPIMTKTRRKRMMGRYIISVAWVGGVDDEDDDDNDDGVHDDNGHDVDLNEKDDDDGKIYHQCSLGGWGISATELRSWVAPDEKSQRPFSSSATAELQCAGIKSLRLFSWCTSL